MTSFEESQKNPCAMMLNVFQALSLAQGVLNRDDLDYHKLEQKGRTTQVEVLQGMATSAMESCVNCSYAENNLCPAFTVYTEAKQLVIGPITTGMGQNGKFNMGFGN